MKNTVFIMLEEFSRREQPNWKALRKAIIFWISKKLIM